MNTQKQISLMVLLVAVLLGGCAAYTVYDQPREEASAKAQNGLYAERGARIFARYCRQCHGEHGEGRIGPAIGSADPYRDPAKLAQNQVWITDTITCGRIGKVMPPWAIREGGALNDEQIRDLVTLITTNAGNAWDKAADFSAVEDQTAPLPSIDDVLAGAVITGSGDTRVCGQLAPATEAAADNGTLPANLKPQDNWTEVATDNKFSITAMAISAGQQVTVTEDRQGQAVHNWQILGPDKKVLTDDAGKQITTQLLPGGQKDSVTFTISKPGVYSYQCSVHPLDMIGKMYVVGPDGTTGGGGAPAATPAAGGTPSVGPGSNATAPTPPAGSTAPASAPAPGSTPVPAATPAR